MMGDSLTETLPAKLAKVAKALSDEQQQIFLLAGFDFDALRQKAEAEAKAEGRNSYRIPLRDVRVLCYEDVLKLAGEAITIGNAINSAGQNMERLALALADAAMFFQRAGQLRVKIPRSKGHRSKFDASRELKRRALRLYDQTVGEKKKNRQAAAAKLLEKELRDAGWGEDEVPKLKPKTIGDWVREREKRWETFRSRALAEYDQTTGDTPSERAALVAQAIGAEPDAANAETILRWVRSRGKSRLPKSRISVV